MSHKWKEFWTLFLVQAFQYCIICISYISLAKGSYAWTFGSDIVCGLNGYFIIRKIANNEAKNSLGIIGYTLGGATGSILAIWIAKRLVHA